MHPSASGPSTPAAGASQPVLTHRGTVAQTTTNFGGASGHLAPLVGAQQHMQTPVATPQAHPPQPLQQVPTADVDQDPMEPELYSMEVLEGLRVGQAGVSDGPGVTRSVNQTVGEIWRCIYFHPSFFDVLLLRIHEPGPVKWDVPHLKRYLQFIWVRVLEQELLVMDAAALPEWAVFNTGLQDVYGADLYVYLTHNNPKYSASTLRPIAPLFANGSSVKVSADQCWSFLPVSLPKAPTFYSAADPRLLFDWTKPDWVNDINTWHIAHSLPRFVEAGLITQAQADDEANRADLTQRLMQQVIGAAQVTLRRMRTQPRLAYIQYYYAKVRLMGVPIWCGRLQYLLPLFMTSNEYPQLAIAVGRREIPDKVPGPDGKPQLVVSYFASTLLTPEMAYFNSRMVQEIHVPWIIPRHLVSIADATKDEQQPPADTTPVPMPVSVPAPAPPAPTPAPVLLVRGAKTMAPATASTASSAASVASFDLDTDEDHKDVLSDSASDASSIPDTKSIPDDAPASGKPADIAVVTGGVATNVAYTNCSAEGCTETGMWVGPKPVPKKWRCSKHQIIRVQCSRFGCNREFNTYPNEREKYYCSKHYRAQPTIRVKGDATTTGADTAASFTPVKSAHDSYSTL